MLNRLAFVGSVTTFCLVAIAPGEPASARADYKQVLLFDRLQTKLADLNPKIPLEGEQEALRKIRLISHPVLIKSNRAFAAIRVALP